jgi:hypothetical protein
MLGTLLNLSGPVTKDEIEDVILRFILVEDSDCEVDGDDKRRAGRMLLEAHAIMFAGEKEETFAAKEEGSRDKGAFGIIFRAFKRTYLGRMHRRGFKHVDEEDAADAFPWEFPGLNPEDIRLVTKSMAIRIGQAAGDTEAGQAIAVSDYVQAQEKRHGSDWWKGS